MSKPTKEELLAYITSRFLGSISTVNKAGRPESAFVGYVCNDAFELVIGTSNKSRKYANISTNKNVAFIVADTTGEVQYEGVAETISHNKYSRLIKDGKFKKLSGYDKYRGDPTQAFVKISPTWIRFLLHFESDKIAEFTEFA